MHRLLERQLAIVVGNHGPSTDPAVWRRLIEKVSEAYEQTDVDRRLLERSLDLASQELIERNQALRDDISLMREIEADLLRERDHTRLLLDNANALVVGVDREHRITLFNRAAHIIAGVPADDVVHERWLDRAVAAPELRAFHLALEDVMVQGSTSSLDTSVMSATSGERRITWRVSPVLDADRVTGALLFGSDETDRLRLEKEAREDRERMIRSERLSSLGTLVAGVAHEVNNPLTYIIGNLEMAALDLDEAASAVDAGRPVDAGRLRATLRGVEKAIEGANRIARITRSLKAMSRVRDRAYERIDVVRVVADVADLVRLTLPARVDLVVDVSATPIEVFGGPAELNQVFLNLTKNSIDALGENAGRIRLATVAQDGHAEITVQDDGPGIPPDVLPRLFDPFFTTKASGTGLGLAITHRIVEEHKGDIAVESVAGVGTSFRIRLPLCPDA
ncbi:MAG TPA: ATP-binding protein [Candidatus Thermoplasmatota archaeon]|nr:ATP-binding protein [Candidatus Thermoplasmatota archaeon]